MPWVQIYLDRLKIKNEALSVEDYYLNRSKQVYITLEDGAMSLIDKMLTRIDKGVKKEAEFLHEDYFAAKLQDYFGINYDELFHQRFK